MRNLLTIVGAILVTLALFSSEEIGFEVPAGHAHTLVRLTR